MKPQQTEPVQVTKADKELALKLGELFGGGRPLWAEEVIPLLAAHRVAAERAALERAALWIEQETDLYSRSMIGSILRGLAGAAGKLPTMPAAPTGEK